MKKIWIALIFMMLLINQYSDGQYRHRPGMQGGQRPEKLEKYRKMRMIEYLNLSEDDAIKFFAKHNTLEQAMRDMMVKRDELVDDLEQKIKSNTGISEVTVAAEKIRSIDKEMFDQRQKFQDDIKRTLTPIQFAKFILFERDFGRKVRDAIRELGPELPPNPDRE
ncbi:MAG: hypothetical protein HY964_09380 [Ignavibacteriales bacterium]|nr:hypothetical protein [Ignavibacteriales bacterium]